MDERMNEALQVLIDKSEGPMVAGIFNPNMQGQVHFDMEKGGQPSRWNTLRALRVLERYSKTAINDALVGCLRNNTNVIDLTWLKDGPSGIFSGLILYRYATYTSNYNYTLFYYPVGSIRSRSISIWCGMETH